MSCTSCTTKTNGAPKGCRNNGSCGTSGCNKLSVFDWLQDLEMPDGDKRFIGVEIQFKNSRKQFFKNADKLPLQVGDVVATEANPGHDIGVVTLTGELVRIQMQKKKQQADTLDTLPKIYRKANTKDIETWQALREKENKVQKEAREIALRLGLKMKISDVEYQGDGSKIIFYYTAEERVDFRQLIKDLARAFQTRIEMKQIGFRQEASRLGGVGSCGRELCCSTWLTDFRSVNTAAARYQQLSLNPLKLAGQCGKLKCCLNYELDGYLEALDAFPRTDTKLKTAKGMAHCQKIDIFKKTMWFAYVDDPMIWHPLPTQVVHEIKANNQKGNTVPSLEMYAIEETKNPEKDFTNTVGQDSLTRFDRPKKTHKKKPHHKRHKKNSRR